MEHWKIYCRSNMGHNQNYAFTSDIFDRVYLAAFGNSHFCTRCAGVHRPQAASAFDHYAQPSEQTFPKADSLVVALVRGVSSEGSGGDEQAGPVSDRVDR